MSLDLKRLRRGTGMGGCTPGGGDACLGSDVLGLRGGTGGALSPLEAGGAGACVGERSATGGGGGDGETSSTYSQYVPGKSPVSPVPLFVPLIHFSGSGHPPPPGFSYTNTVSPTLMLSSDASRAAKGNVAT